MNAPDLRPSQIDGVDFLSARRAAILADDTGLGKSVQSIRAADKVGARRVLVLCQAIGRVSWALEFPKWQLMSREVMVYENRTPSIPTGPLALIVAYSTLSTAHSRKRLERLLSVTGAFEGFDVVILDEAHHLAHPKSARTQAVYGSTLDRKKGVLDLVDAKHVWPLSATIQRGNAGELFPHLRALFPHVLAKLFGFVPTHKDFLGKYTIQQKTPYGLQVLGNNNDKIAELREAMRPYILRRAKRDVAAELGDIVHIPLPLEVDPKEVAERAREIELAAFFEGIDGMDIDDVGELPLHVARQWRALGEMKVQACVEWARDFLDQNPGQKLVIFAHHREVLDRLHAELAAYLPCVIHGGVPAGTRVKEVSEFQGNPKARVFLGQTIAAGTSITLTAASTVLMVEQEWTPADNYQAISRVHRIGQTEPVTAYYAYAANTLDEKIAARARRKAADFETLMDPLTKKA